jgi:asparagine synthase (glutamine-hydrolysing)
MADSLAHRGPDDSGCYLDPARRAGLGFRRLSIIDLSPSGHQPMTDEDGRLWLVYNGEIYNYQALRKELIACGHEFRSTSDSEVILHGFQEWGPAVVKRLRGMFAYALWDAQAGELHAARDRLGIKPFIYYWDGKRFMFGSEIKALLAAPGVDADIDRSALWDYFTYLNVPTPKTAYRHVRKLPPAHTLRFDGQALKVEEYWDVEFGDWRLEIGDSRLPTADRRPPTANLQSPISNLQSPISNLQLPITNYQSLVEPLRDKLRDAVQAHMIADVPVGLLLSGGLDSSSVAAFARESHGQPIRTFSIGFDVAAHDETAYARLVAERFGTQHHERVVARDSLEAALELVCRTYDEPFADASGIPTYHVSALAREHVKVALSGDGGDEIFAGYKWYRAWLDLRKHDSVPLAVRDLAYNRIGLGVLGPLAGLPKVPGLIGRMQMDLAGLPPLEQYGTLMSRIRPYQKARLLPDLAREFREYDDYWHFRRYWRDELDPISRMQYLDIKTYLPDDILTKVDRASMANSLEVRVPLLDHELVECVAAMPPQARWDKRILREAMRGLLPDEILTRSKKGFSAPLLDWLKPETHNGVRLGGLAQWAVKVEGKWKERMERKETQL